MEYTKVSAEKFADMVMAEPFGVEFKFGLPIQEDHSGVENGIEWMGNCYTFESPTYIEYFMIEESSGGTPQIVSVSSVGQSIDDNCRDDIESAIEKFFKANDDMKFVFARVDD